MMPKKQKKNIHNDEKQPKIILLLAKLPNCWKKFVKIWHSEKMGSPLYYYQMKAREPQKNFCSKLKGVI